MENDILKIVNQWRNFKDLDPELKEEIDRLSDSELEDAFYQNLSFGTGGLRGVLGVGTNRMNIYVIRKTTLGFYQYMKKHFNNIEEQGVVISYDCRRNSWKFAKCAAEVFATHGVKVYLFSGLRPTPELSFAVRYLNALGGIMITASHNPPKYNGYKVYDDKGCQLVPELADEVISEISKISDPFQIIVKPFEQLKENGLIELIDQKVDDAYLEQVSTVTINDVDKKKIKIVFTPLHGTASVHLAKLLEDSGYDVYPVDEQMIPDPNFSTLKSPNPEDASAFQYAINLGKKVNADILIATDPDADRMGIACKQKNGDYQLLTGNQTGAILLDYLGQFKKHGKKAIVYNTIVTSSIAQAICKKYDLTLVQTLTGFKYIGEQAALIENTDAEFFFGYEESYGYVIKDFVRDKDSLQATLLLSEVAAFYAMQGKTLVDRLDELFNEFGYYVEGVHNFVLEGEKGSQLINKIMRSFQKHQLIKLGDEEIVAVEDYDRLIRIERGLKTHLNLRQSFVLKYIFADGGWFVLRPSGTEPKLKVYISLVGKNEQETQNKVEKAKKELILMVNEIINLE